MTCMLPNTYSVKLTSHEMYSGKPHDRGRTRGLWDGEIADACRLGHIGNLARLQLHAHADCRCIQDHLENLRLLPMAWGGGLCEYNSIRRQHGARLLAVRIACLKLWPESFFEQIGCKLKHKPAGLLQGKGQSEN
jgi:hypothetical protein